MRAQMRLRKDMMHIIRVRLIDKLHELESPIRRDGIRSMQIPTIHFLDTRSQLRREINDPILR